MHRRRCDIVRRVNPATKKLRRYPTSDETGLQPHYRTRISVGGCLIQLASWDEPTRVPGEAYRWQASWITDPDYGGDTIGVIVWSAVSSVTWQFVP